MYTRKVKIKHILTELGALEEKKESDLRALFKK